MDFDATKNKAQDAVSSITGDSDAAPDHAEERGATNQTDYQNQPDSLHQSDYQTKANDLDQTDYQNQPDGGGERGHRNEE